MDWCVYHCRYGYRKRQGRNIYTYNIYIYIIYIYIYAYIYIPNNSTTEKSKGL